jgi:RNA polymerase sigma-70 factor, ECF subfamily
MAPYAAAPPDREGPVASIDDDPRRPVQPPFDLGRAFDEHGAVLFAFAVNATRDRHAAEDCVQETFLRAWRARDRFDGRRAGERTWLFAILRNVVVDGYRSAARRPEPVEQQEEAAPEIDLLGRLGLLEALARLTPEHRSVVVAVHVEGTPYAELADRTGVPVATLRSRCFYALRALRGHLDDGRRDGEEGGHP